MCAINAGSQQDVLGLACGVFKDEIESLRQQGKITIPFDYLDSMLHIYPMQLKEAVDKKLAAVAGRQIVLVYGECHAWMAEIAAGARIRRVTGLNCCEIILGRELYRQWRTRGAFFLLPEWARRWEEVFRVKLGFNQINARDFMRDMHTRLVYIDTGVSAVPHEALRAAADYCGLPYEILATDLQVLLDAINLALKD